MGSFYPNPSNRKIFVDVCAVESGSWNLTITDTAGKTMYAQVHDLQKGMNRIGLNRFSREMNLVRIEYLQFSEAEHGRWKNRPREEGSVFDLVLGVFVCGMENLQFVDWARQHHLPQDEAYELFTILDPNCVRLD